MTLAAFAKKRPLCYFGHFSDKPCGGRMDPCHLISKRVLKREWSRANPRLLSAWFEPGPLTDTDLEDLLNDRRNIVASCRHHHHAADQGFITFEVPASAYEFAAEIGLEHQLPVREEAA